MSALRAQTRIDSWVALLWTWLEPKLTGLDSRAEKLWELRRLGQREVVDAEFDFAAALVKLSASDDMRRAAAMTLVALDRWVAEAGRAETIHSLPVAGMDGAGHIVAARSSWLAEAFWEGSNREREVPPSTDYAPSMSILAPTITVSPASLKGLRVQLLSRPDDASAEARRSLAATRLQLAAVACGEAREVGQPTSMLVHLATLGPNQRATKGGGLAEADGYVVVGDRNVFTYGDPPAGGMVDLDICAAVEAAVRAAARDEATILLLPELALPATALRVLEHVLAETPRSPSLTVAGLRHRDVVAAGEPESDASGAALSPWANEAVVLGPDGVELLRHRELTGFALGSGGPQEDTRLGDRLAVLPTAIGNIAVLTCLDAFASSWIRLLQSPASLVLVPSLSPRVNPHRSTLVPVTTWLWGMAFVCNRHPTAAGDAAWLPDAVRSCWTVGMLNGWQPAATHAEGEPTLVFDLDTDRAGTQ